jgi:PST family polysaccharide transporter
MYGAVSAIALAALAVPAAGFFGEPRLVAIFFALGSGAFLQSFENVGIVAFQKDLDFRKEFNFRILKKVVGFVVTIVLAFTLRNYWALVFGLLTSRIIGVPLSYALHPFRPRFSLVSVKELWHFSAWMLLNNVVVYAAVNGYDFIIGRMAGATSLGLYSIAYEISNLPTTELVHPLSRAIFPGFSKLANDRKELRATLLRSASLIALITFPLGAGIAALAEPAVHLMLGVKWLETIPIIQVLAIYGILRTAHAGTGAAYIAVGAQRAIAAINLPHLLVGWPLILIWVPKLGLIGAAYAVLCASVVGLGINLLLSRRLLGLPTAKLLACFWRPFVAASIMSMTEFVLLRTWPLETSLWALLAQTLVCIAIGAIAYVSVVLGLWTLAGRPDGGERLMLERLFRGRRFTPTPRPGSAS